jgi:hypothetical protein
MNLYRRVSLAVLLIIGMGLLVSLSAFAGETPAEADAQTQTAPAPTPQNTASPADGWHFEITPYLWFAGLSGTTGAFGHEVSVHASPGDLLSHFDIGLMGVVEARKGRILLPVDFLWIKLQGDKTLPFDQDLSSAKLKMTQTLLTPKFGYRIVDKEKLKVDAFFGIRYWHLGQNLSFQPSGIVPNFSPSANWVDGNGGMRFELPLSPKAAITVAGDVGAGGANLDYQVLGVLGYRVGRKVVLDAGWRYLYVDYRPGAPKFFVYDAHMSGALLGVTFDVK